MPEILVRKNIIPGVNLGAKPEGLNVKVSAVLRSLQECEDLVKMFGHEDMRPTKPILILIPGHTDHQGRPVHILVAGEGEATAAELRDLCVTTWFRAIAKLGKTGGLVDFQALREKAGLLPREQFDSAFRDALARRIKQHKQNPVSDPPRIPLGKEEKKVFSAG